MISHKEATKNSRRRRKELTRYICKVYLKDTMNESRTTYVILGMLSIEPDKSGYDIRKAIEDTVGHFWRESYGQIYPTLKRLTAQGLIAAAESKDAARKGRQEYFLTDAGRDCLQEWLAVPFQDPPPRNEFLLKLFFGGQVDLDVSREHILAYREKNRQLLNTLMAVEKFAQNPPTGEPPPYWMLTLTLGIALSRTTLEWSESALATLETMKKQAALKETDGKSGGEKQSPADESKGRVKGRKLSSGKTGDRTSTLSVTARKTSDTKARPADRRHR